jgi:hypothetical protein
MIGSVSRAKAKVFDAVPKMGVGLAKQYNPVIRGWWNYFGAFYRTAMQTVSGYIDQRLEKWARRKYKTLLRRKRGSVDWLRRMKSESPRMFFHWSVAGNQVG